MLKTLRLILDPEEDDVISVGLIRLSKKVPEHEFFFQVNQLNPFHFSRIDDFKLEGKFYDNYFARFEAYSRDEKICIHIISNKSHRSVQKNDITELFTGEENHTSLLNYHEDVDYIIKTSDVFQDFSLILLPENLTFQIQEYSLQSGEELYSIFQYYE